MEDIKRDLEKELNAYKIPNPYAKKRVWQLIFLSNDGKMRSVKRYKGVVTFITLLLVISIAAAGMLSFLYKKNLEETRELRTSLEEANLKIKSGREERELLMARVVLAESRIKKMTATERPEKKIKKSRPAPPPIVKPAPPKSKPKMVNISKLVTTRKGNRNTLFTSFMVKNTSGIQPVSGRIYVVLKTNNNPEEWVVSPEVPLKDGAPKSPDKGQFFSINRFKTVKFKIPNSTAGKTFTSTTVYVYKTDGELMLEQTFPNTIDGKKKSETAKN